MRSRGGGPPYHVLKARILASTPNISSKRLEKSICDAEYHKARWINHHDSLAVYSPNCTKQGFVSFSGIIGSCIACSLVLHLKTFQNALRHTPSLKQKHTPKRYRNEVLGECFLRHIDVYDLVMLVCVLLNVISSCTYYNYYFLVG